MPSFEDLLAVDSVHHEIHFDLLAKDRKALTRVNIYGWSSFTQYTPTKHMAKHERKLRPVPVKRIPLEQLFGGVVPDWLLPETKQLWETRGTESSN